MKSKFKIIATGLLLGAMVACGGSGGSTTSTNSENNSSANTPTSEATSSTDLQTSEATSSTDVQTSEGSTSTGSGVEYETVNYEVNISNLETGVQQTDTIVNKFTIPAGTEIRNRTKTFNGPNGSIEYTKSVKIGSSSASIIVNSPGEGTLKFHIQNGSSGVEYQKVVISGPNGAETLTFDGTISSSPVVELEIPVAKGTYTIKRDSGTIDIYWLSLSCTVEKADETGFEIVSAGKVDYFEGENFDSSSLQLNKVYGNGRTDVLETTSSDVTIDSSAFNPNVPGTYPISVKYKDYDAITYNVNVYGVEGLTLGFDAIEKIANSSAGNGVYFNRSVREVYRVGEAFDTTGLSVKVNTKLNSETKDFLLSSGVTFTGFDSETSGEKVVTVSFTTNGKTVTKTFSVYVVAEAPAKNGDVFQVKVDQNYAGTIGTVENGYNMFTTVQQALNYLENSSEITNADQKLLYIEEGTYTEKLEVTIPYLTVKGANAENTIIEWDSLYGVEDEMGFVHTTDSTATVAVREQAFHCTFEDVTISNFYNSQARFDERGYGIERALALLVQSDQFIMRGSKLLGVQDTLELFTGRQYFEDTFISGYTDFIFGTNNTTYFTNCQIHTIDTSKDDSGTAGYITAFKGNNKGSSDAIKYGAIFDECNFTADDGVMQGKTAIGRTWAAYAAVAVINSELGDHISTTGYSSNKNERYIAMNGKPTDSTTQFVEYNNTGEGAITEAVAGCTMLTAEEAANYSNFEIIFGTTNGNVTYSDAWDPSSSEIVVDDSIYYMFNGQSSVTGTSYTYTDNIQGTTGTFEGLSIDATSGKVTARTSDTQINAGAKISFDVEAGTKVTVSTYPGYHDYTLNGVATTADTFTQYYAENTTVVFEAKTTVYLYSITINPNEEAPEAATATGITISGQTVSFTEGDAFTYEGLVVKANYSDNSVVTLDSADYTVALDRDVDGAGKYTATVTYGEFTAKYEVEYVAVGVDASIITENTQITFGSAGNYKTSKLTYDETKMRDNGGDNTQITGPVSFKVAAGATVTVNGYPNYTSYTVSIDGAEIAGEQTAETYTFTVAEGGEVTLTNVSNNNYFYSISIEYAE